MKSFVLAAAAAACLCAAMPAQADPTGPAHGDATVTTIRLPSRDIVGRIRKPLVVIVVKAPSAASQAGAAHEALRDALLDRAEPATMHVHP